MGSVANADGKAEMKRMVTVQERDRCSTRPVRRALSAGLSDALHRRFSARRVQYISEVLTGEELAVIADLADALIIARIKRMPDHRLERFDDLCPLGPKQQRHYQALQLQWLRDEEYLLGTRLGRRPTQKELFIDFMNNHNGLRFRAYFALKFPREMKAGTEKVC